MLIAMLNSTFILVAIFKYDCHKRDVTFEKFWRTRCFKHLPFILPLLISMLLSLLRCEADWELSYKAFTIGNLNKCGYLTLFTLVNWLTIKHRYSVVLGTTCTSRMGSFLEASVQKYCFRLYLSDCIRHFVIVGLPYAA